MVAHLRTHTTRAIIAALITLKPRPKNKALRSLLHSSPPSDDGQEAAANEAAAATDESKQCDASTTVSSDQEGVVVNSINSSSLATAAPSSKEKDNDNDMVPFWKPALDLHLVHHFDGWPRAGQLPPFIVEQVTADCW